MENRFLLCLKCLVTICVFAFFLSVNYWTVQAAERMGLGALNGKIAQKVKRLVKDRERFRKAAALHKKHIGHLMDLSGVVGTGIGSSPEGEPVIKVFTSRPGVTGIPTNIDGIPVKEKVSGRFYALVDSTARFPRPVPIGVSTGHPAITAGTIGARVVDRFDPNRIYALSNNHVYAAINTATIGDSVIQPGRFDGGALPNDFIGVLAAYQDISFCEWWWFWLICPEINTIDAAIVDVIDPGTGEVLVDTGTPPDGYNKPNSIIHPGYGDPYIISDQDDNLSLLVGQSVQKYGRTTGLTYGTIDTYGFAVNVCYDEPCDLVARFEDQLVITPGDFSGGGDSGSLIVTNDENKNPVGLLFAGSATDTLANRIDRVLVEFGVSIDSGPTLPTLTINDVTVNEGDSGPTDAVFTVTLSAQNDDMVTVDFFTLDDTATVGIDYTYTAGTLTFDIGETTRTIAVRVNGDTADEEDETFYVNLTNANLATIADGEGVGTIMDDDAAIPLPPDVSIGDVTVAEGDSGPTNAVFTVSLSAQSDDVVTVDYHTSPGTATADDDYVSTYGTLTFLIGETTQTIAIPVYGDTQNEDDETFYVNLTSATGAAIVDGQGVGTITNDDAPEPSSDPKLWTGTVTARTDQWTTVPVGQNYIDMVVICTPNYDITINTPVTAQVKDALDDTFDVKIAPAVFGLSEFEPPWTAEVHCMAVEAGVYTETEHGVKMEAVKYTSTVTDRNGSWNGQLQTYANAYQNPVVLGQVMTYNCSDLGAGEDRCHCTVDIMNPGCYWNVFWSRSASSAKNPPNNTTNEFSTGKHVGEDTWSWVNDETIGYIVIEAGEGTIGTTRYYAGLGSDSIRGVGNSPPYTYVLSGLSFQPSTAILSQAAMDGGNGGWAILYGDNPIRANGSNIELRTAIEEDWSLDSERKHTTEQVSFFVSE
ncbi:MAG: hypothetical protein JSU72_16660 [Deltaproteobacteria bacterium]|nr:MAG: hypothetical protein JSU72_16660 [Deltaproteobacteria bacterium]